MSSAEMSVLVQQRLLLFVRRKMCVGRKGSQNRIIAYNMLCLR